MQPSETEGPPPAEIIWPDFTQNALRRYFQDYEHLLRWLSGLPLTTDERAAAMRASFTRQRLMNEAGSSLSGPGHEV